MPQRKDARSFANEMMELSVADIRELQNYLWETYGVEVIVNTPPPQTNPYPSQLGIGLAIDPNLVKVAEKILYTRTDIVTAFEEGHYRANNPNGEMNINTQANQWLKTYTPQVHYVLMSEIK
jgi:hypothetical protein